MGRVLVNESTLTSIADAIREKRGTTSTIKPAEMANNIKAITGDGIDYKALAIGTAKEITIPYKISENGVLTLKGGTFGGLKLDTLSFDEGITKIECASTYYPPFYWSVANTIYFPSSLTYIGDGAFKGCVVNDNLIFSEGLTYIGAAVFAPDINIDGASSNESSFASKIVIPTSVETIGTRAFYDVRFSEVYFKGTPTEIGASAFYHDATGSNTNKRYIYVPWSKGQGPTISGLNNYTEIVYDYVYDEEV